MPLPTPSTPNVRGNPSFRLASSANSTNATSVLQRPGTLRSIIAINTGATAAYIKFYDQTTTPTVGTDPILFVIPLPPTNGVVVFVPPEGVRFNAGIGYAVTGAMADADTTTVAAGQVAFSGTYQ